MLVLAVAGFGGAGAESEVLGIAAIAAELAVAECQSLTGLLGEGGEATASPSTANFLASRSRCVRKSCAALEVYLASILSAPSASQPCCLKNCRARWLPPKAMSLSCSGVHESSVVDRTKLMCTPRLRWMPAQDRHMNTPYGTEAHVGFLAA